MACNSCSKSFTLFRKEKGCPGCGFSYCSNCLDNKIFVKKLNKQAKVCSKCKQSDGQDTKKLDEPPDIFYKRMGVSNKEADSKNCNSENNNTEEEIKKRLQKLKLDRNGDSKRTTDEEISKRLQGLKGPQPTTSDAELEHRLANLKGVTTFAVQNKPIVVAPDTRTELEQANDLMKQYLEQVNIDTQYQEGFNQEIDNIEARIQKLRGVSTSADSKASALESTCKNIESDDEETMVKKIIDKAKAESLLQYDDDMPATTDELPFCEICNEDATMRCLGCRYLFCKQCFLDHKDDDDGCNKYEPYQPPKT